MTPKNTKKGNRTGSGQDAAASDAIVDSFRAAQEAAVIEVADQGLKTIAELVSGGAIDISPTFQRRDRWSPEKQSALIESFLLNIPVPPVYLAEDINRLGKYAVIDGKQRLTSIAIFFEDRLVLRGLEKLQGINGLRYSDLPEGVRVPLGMKGLRVTTLLRQSEENLKHEVFLRLNTGGEILNAQEIRNVAYRGPLNSLVYELAENEFLRRQFKVKPPSSPAYRQMTDAEYVLRFITLSERWKAFKGDLRREMDRFMIQNRFADQAELDRWRGLFSRCIHSAEAIWGESAFKRPGRDQALAGLFDAEMIALAESDPSVHTELVRKRSTVRRRVEKLFDDVEFDEAVRRGTNTPARLKHRTERMLDLVRAIV
jgi:hypothetical protein